MAHLFLTKFIEMLHVPKMSLQRDLRLRSIQAEGLRRTDCQRARWAQPFFTSSLWPSLQFFWGLSKQLNCKTFNDEKLATLTTQIRRRWKYQSTMESLSGFTFLSTSPRPLRMPRCYRWRCQLNCVTSLVDGACALAVWIHLRSPMLPEGYRKKLWKNDIFTTRLSSYHFFRCLLLFENRPPLSFNSQVFR